MQPLDALIGQARALANAALVAGTPEAEVARQLQICNACRYCEGFCAVFPAMTRRLEFNPADIHYLANLCNNCGACLHACQYAPPHEFAVNVPQAMARVRLRTYTDFAWPRALGVLYRRNGLLLVLALALMLAFFVTLAMPLQGSVLIDFRSANFYTFVPHQLMVVLFAPVFLYAALALGLGVRRFWARNHAGRECRRHPAQCGAGRGDRRGLASEIPGRWSRRRLQQRRRPLDPVAPPFSSRDLLRICAVFRGDRRGHAVPLPRWRARALRFAQHPEAARREWWPESADRQRRAAMAQPAPSSATRRRSAKTHGHRFYCAAVSDQLHRLGAVAGARHAGVPNWLGVHLGVVMALFLTLPYGKFAHGLFRAAALLKWALEKRQPSQLQLGDD